MNKAPNPYPENIIDDCSGISVPNLAHRVWLEGFQAGVASASIDESEPQNPS